MITRDVPAVAPRRDPRLYHLREEQGRREIDLLIETAGGRLIGVEIKAAALVTKSDAHRIVAAPVSAL